MSCNAFHYVFNLEEARHKTSYMKLKASIFPDSWVSLKSVKITEERKNEEVMVLEDDTCQVKNLYFISYF